MDDETRQEFKAIREAMNAKFEALTTLIVDFKESLEREIHNVGERIDHTEAHLKRIAAGAHYVTRLVEWSEKQDDFSSNILERVQKLESTVEQLKKDRR